MENVNVVMKKKKKNVITVAAHRRDSIRKAYTLMKLFLFKFATFRRTTYAHENFIPFVGMRSSPLKLWKQTNV